jgi:hypothetical protein
MYPVPPFLSLLQHKTRVAVLALLIVVLPLQSVAQLVAGMQGHRHVHSASLLKGLLQPLQGVLDRLHAAQDPRLAVVSRPMADGWHDHGGVWHKHSRDSRDAVDVGDAGDEAQQAGATVFIAWLPAALNWPDRQSADHPAVAARAWRDRVVAPPRTPPRG